MPPTTPDPPTHLCCDLVAREYPNVPPIPNCGRSLENLSALAQHLPVQAGPLEEVCARKVQLAEVTTVVHVIQ